MSFPFCAVLSGLMKHTLSRAVLPGRGCPFVHRLHAGDAPTGSTPGGRLGGRVMGHVTVLAQVTLVLLNNGPKAAHRLLSQCVVIIVLLCH